MEHAPEDPRKKAFEAVPGEAVGTEPAPHVETSDESSQEYKPNFVLVEEEESPEPPPMPAAERDLINTAGPERDVLDVATKSEYEPVAWPNPNINLPIPQMTPLEQHQHLADLVAEVEKVQGATNKPEEGEETATKESAPEQMSPEAQDAIDKLIARKGELAKQGGEFVRKTGEWYRKLPFKYKMGVSAALLAGTVFTGGTGVFVTLLGAAHFGQRALASAGVYSLVDGLMEKRIAAREEKTGEVRTKYDSWKKYGYSSAAALAVFSGIPGFGLHELFSGTGSESALTHLHETITSGHASSVVEAHTSSTASISVEVQHGRGYEQMAWDLHKALHAPGAHFDPKTIVPGSDLEKIWNADGDELKGVVHRLAIAHGFTSPGATILEHSHMTFDEHGSLVVTQGEHGASFADAPKGSAAAHAPIPEARPEHLTPAPAESPASVQTDHVAPAEKTNFSGRTGERMPYGKDAGAGAHIPYQNAMNPEHAPTPASVVPAPEHVAEAVTQHAPMAEVGEHFVVNAHGLPVDTSEAHIYTDAPDGKGRGVVFGGDSVKERIIAARNWITNDHSRVLYFDSTKPRIMRALGFTPLTEVTQAVWDEASKTVQFVTSATDSNLQAIVKNLPSIDDLASQLDVDK